MEKLPGGQVVSRRSAAVGTGGSGEALVSWSSLPRGYVVDNMVFSLDVGGGSSGFPVVGSLPCSPFLCDGH